MTQDEARRLLQDGELFFYNSRKELEECEDEDEKDMQTLNLNDTFGWALAWGEYVPDEELIKVAELFKQYGEAGVFYWASCRNDNFRSGFEDINRKIDFVRNEERIKQEKPDWNERAYYKASYSLGMEVKNNQDKPRFSLKGLLGYLSKLK